MKSRRLIASPLIRFQPQLRNRATEKRDELASSHLPPEILEGHCIGSVTGSPRYVRLISLWASSGHSLGYSMTSSARAISVGGTDRPSALAVLRLITNSSLVGCSTGRSPGCVPLKILSIRVADRRYRSG